MMIRRRKGKPPFRKQPRIRRKRNVHNRSSVMMVRNDRRPTRTKDQSTRKPRMAIVLPALAVVLFFAAAVTLGIPRNAKEQQRKKPGLGAGAVAGSLLFANEGGGDQPTSAEIPYKNGTAEESTRGARMLYEQFVKDGKVTFAEGCQGTAQDFRDQMARHHTNRGSGHGTFINPSFWRAVQIIAEGQERRKNPLPYVEVTCLSRGHSFYTKGGKPSNHILGNAGDIGTIGGERIGSPKRQYPYDHVYQAIHDLWEAGFYPCQLVSIHGTGGIGDVTNPSLYGTTCTGFGARGAFADYGEPDRLDGHEDHLHIDANLAVK